jgi:hypothetical protein
VGGEQFGFAVVAVDDVAEFRACGRVAPAVREVDRADFEAGA